MFVGTFVKRVLTPALLIAAISAAAGGPSRAASDSDGDGVGDNLDNCVTFANVDQRDTDGDGIGNACDADLNDDCIVNPTDLGIFRSVFLTADPNADFNGDGVVNPTDLGIFRLLFLAAPGPSGAPNACTCAPPAVVPVNPNAEFNGQEMFLLGSLAQSGVALAGVNNFADQDDGLYLARLFVRTAGTFDYTIADQASSIEYCSDSPLAAYAPLDVPFFGCAAPPGSVQVAAPGCYEFAMRTDQSVLPGTVELTFVERLGRWDIDVDAGGGLFAVPNGVVLDVPPGAVAGPVTLTIGDVPCAQVDALFAATTLNSHDNRCIGAFSGEPDGFAFNATVTASLPATALLPDEVPLWLASTPGEQDYTLIETVVTYRGDLATVEATIDSLSIVASAGATPREPVSQRVAGLPSCCTEVPTPLDCCCTTIRVTVGEGDSFSTDCDCQLVGQELEVVFPTCPGSPVQTVSESHSSENCPTDFQPAIVPSTLTMWTCEDRDLEARLSGTNQDGSTCGMQLPTIWNIDSNIATLQEIGPNMVRVTGAGAGVAPLSVTSLVGSQFSFSVPLTVVDIGGAWDATEDGEQTCVSGGESFTEADQNSGTIQVSVDSCSTISLDVGVQGVAPETGTLTRTTDPALPFTFVLDTPASSSTLGCVLFTESNANDIDFGTPPCPDGVTCQALSCTESITTNGTLAGADVAAGVGDSSWTFNASWSETIDGMTTNRSGVCNGAADLTFTKQ